MSLSVEGADAPPIEALYTPSALIDRAWRRDVLFLIDDDGRILDIADRTPANRARQVGAVVAAGPVAPALCAVLRDASTRRRFADEAGAPAYTAAERGALAAAVYADCAAAGFTRLADVATVAADDLGDTADALDAAGRMAGVALCITPVFASSQDAAQFMPALGRFAEARRGAGDRWGFAIDDLPQTSARKTLDFALAAAETRPGAPRHLLWPKNEADAPGAEAHLGAIVAAASIAPHWGLLGGGGAGAAGRAFNAAGGVLFGPAGPAQPKRRRGVEIAADGPTCSAALLRATFGSSENPTAAREAWRAAAQDAGPALGMGEDGPLKIGARADFVVFDSDHPTLGGAPGDALLHRYIAQADARALRMVIAGGRIVAAHGRHCDAALFGRAARGALWSAAHRQA